MHVYRVLYDFYASMDILFVWMEKRVSWHPRLSLKSYAEKKKKT